MGLKVSDNLASEVKGYTLVAYDFSFGNEEKLYFMNEKGEEKTIRISSTLRDLLYDFAAIEHSNEKVA